MITPDSPERLYSTRLRTAVVLTGIGTAGAYQAGALRALHEAGVKIDVVAGRGMGAATAMFAAVDGGSRLWDREGVWKGRASSSFYRWRPALRVAGASLVGACAVLLFPLLLFACAIVIGAVGLLLTLIGLDEAGSVVTVGFTSRLAALFAPPALPTVIPRLVLLAVLIAGASLVASVLAGLVRSRTRRRSRRGIVWRLLGHPLSTTGSLETFIRELWHLIRGVASVQQAKHVEMARRYIELLADNLGQPGFRELLVLLHDIDARQDIVMAFLGEQHRPRFFGRPAGAEGGLRSAEAFDLAGAARDHAIDALAAALTIPFATPPHLATFAVEGPWRGETHRLSDRPASLGRLLEEVALAGAEQVVLVSATPRAAGPHELSSARGDIRGGAGEQIAAFESAALRDVAESFLGRFSGLYVIRPEHNAVGPLDFGGTYDERSDRHFTVAELVDRGYEDAYRQFIDPVVGASGEHIQTVGTR